MGAEVRHGRVRVHVESPVIDMSIQSGTGWISASRSEAVVRLDGLLAFSVSRGRTVVVDLVDGADLVAVDVWLYGLAAALVFAQRGGVPLHATSVDIDGMAVCLAGFPGAGKSTTALELVRRGHRLVADDMSPISTDGSPGGGPVVTPFGRPMHLWPATAAEVGFELPDGHAVMPSGKLVLPPPPSVPAGVGAVIVLGVEERDAPPACEALRACEAVPVLTANVHCGSIIRRVWPDQVFGWATGLASALPVYKLSRPVGRWTLGEMADAVEKIAAEARVLQT